MAKDYYKTLGVPKGASTDEIKKAYKSLAKKYHPDINKDPSASDKFKEINEAAAVLGDEKKRGQYDLHGTADAQQQGQGFSGFDFSDFMNQSQGFGFNFDEIFDTFFGGAGFGRSRRRQQRQGYDLRYDIEITLEEAALGISKEISIPRLEQCESCEGSGAATPSSIETCPQCNGKGMTAQTQRTPFGIFQTQSACRKCAGEGRVITEECESCDGTGVVKKTRKIEVKIPKGAENGTNLRVRGGGEAGERGVPAGDLYIVVHVKKHKVFEREGDDLHLKVPLPFSIAALGGKIDIPTLDGKAELEVPAGSQSNTVFRLKGKGIPHLDGEGKGDLYAEAIISVPQKLSKRQRELLREFETESDKKGFFKEIFD
ncbi:MAG TPA: molecular chaperone DnaJ [Candidatus Nanoarchaeia archaeon]|nr:molecular chaperone DnaJ [Candidatus Nanoarchaeia archaeon]